MELGNSSILLRYEPMFCLVSSLYVLATLSHIAVVNLLHRWNWEILEHPPYSPDMSPCDLDHFAKMKLPLGEIRFRTRLTIIVAVVQSGRRLVQYDTVDGICHLPDVWRWVLNVRRDYF